MDTPTEVLVITEPTPAPADQPPLHAFTGELVVILTRHASVNSATEMEQYMREIVGRFPVLLEHSDSADITVLPTLCGKPVCAICKESTRVLDKLRIDNIREYLEGEAMRLASATQRQRMTSESTRAEEVIAIARAELFRPFADFIVRPKRWANSVIHAKNCRGPNVCWSSVKVPSDDAIGLTSNERATLAKIVEAARATAQHEWLVKTTDGSVVDLKVQTHVGQCGTCEAAHIDHGVLVTIPWAGRTLSREYLL